LKNFTKLITLFAAVPIVLAACRPAAPTVPTEAQVDPNLVYTAAAETAQVRLTENASIAPTLTATPTLEPTETLSPTSSPTQVEATVEATPLPPAAGQPSVGDNAVYVQDVSIPDGSVISAGESFIKTWKIMNTGSTTWKTTYALVHVSDHLLGAEKSVPLTVEVPPNQNVDISVNMVAPNENGSYRGFWRMRNAEGQFFGDAIYVDIRVGAAASSTQAPTSTVVGPTATSAPSTSATVSNVSVTVENPTTTAACPHSYRVEANFDLSAASSVTFKWEAGSDTPGFTFTLPDAQTSHLPAGTQALTFFLQLNNSGSGWVQLHITAPQDVVSNQATFSLTCQ
jgi:hypothetical protein